MGTKPPTLAARWYPQEVVFAARGAAPFELAYGSRSVAPAALPIATLVPGYCRRQATARQRRRRHAGGNAVRRQSHSAARAARRQALVLWGSLVAAALLLGYMALRLARQMRTGSDDA